MDSKTCRTCGLPKPPSEFTGNKRTKDGKSIYCRSCVSAAYLLRAGKRRSSPRPLVAEKHCPGCDSTKPIADFPVRTAAVDGRYHKCKECHAAYKAATFQRIYPQEKERMIRRQTAHAEGVRLFLATLKYERGCIECGERHPACLDFHHREGTVKVAEVSKLVGMMTRRSRLLEEIAKCDVICANCHRKRHAKTFRYMKRWMEEEAALTASS